MRVSIPKLTVHGLFFLRRTLLWAGQQLGMWSQIIGLSIVQSIAEAQVSKESHALTEILPFIFSLVWALRYYIKTLLVLTTKSSGMPVQLVQSHCLISWARLLSPLLLWNWG